jgi:hypothetical protein
MMFSVTTSDLQPAREKAKIDARADVVLKKKYSRSSARGNSRAGLRKAREDRGD